ncbi:MAG: hypothetical protein AAGC56_13850, partial [Pseudomonadota bacterium]
RITRRRFPTRNRHAEARPRPKTTVRPRFSVFSDCRTAGKRRAAAGRLKLRLLLFYFCSNRRKGAVAPSSSTEEQANGRAD